MLIADNPPPLNCLPTAEGYDYRGHQTKTESGLTCQVFNYWHQKVSSYIGQYPVLRTVKSALHFTSLTDLLTQTPSRLLWEASSHMLQLMCESCSYTYPQLSIARNSFIQLSEREQCRVITLAERFNTAAHNSNPG